MEIRIEDSFRDGRFGDLAFLYAPVGLVVTENRVIRDCNHTFAEMFGYVREDLQNRVFSILYPTDAELDNIRDRGVDALRRTNTYWDERIMASKDV
ncbi:MAG: PAS domain-containing protein, partial [Maritimibacter sp.]|nr:PAS domain-containing protein [Maritimibacter sp.]